jgi:membrane-bound serine protease (ClpP class)
MNKILFLFFALFFSFLPLNISHSEESERIIQKVLMLSINSTINPATLNYLQTGFSKASSPQSNFDAILIKINTPGGLVSTTKDILTLMGDSNLPVIVWVTPEGASATSAGAIISAGAHFLFMSRGTNIGAATPVTLTDSGASGTEEKEKKVTKEDPKKSIQKLLSNQDNLQRKAMNDLVALIRSLGESRGRNTELLEEMISKASSFESKVALEKGLINGVASNFSDIWQGLEGKNVTIKGKIFKLHTQNPTVVEQKMDLGQSILDIFANPSLAYILFLLGAALIYLEFQTPGTFVPGAIGVISLILSGIAFQVLPLNFGALGLIVLSFLLFLLETYITSYGILIFVGLLSLTFGSLFLFRTNDSYLDFNTSLVYSSVAGIACIVISFALYWAYDARKNRMQRRQKKDHHKIIGQEGIVVSELGDFAKTENKIYQVKINGELWKARSEKGSPISLGDKVLVLNLDEKQLILVIQTVS